MSSLSARPAGVLLRGLLSDGVKIIGPQDVYATSCTSDARQVRPGDVFVALTDAQHDGHDLATEAAQRGAAAVIGERLLPVFGTAQFIVSDSHAAYGRLCQALMGSPACQLKVVGVTGTSGKTTVARLLASILRAAGGDVGTVDSLGFGGGTDNRREPDAVLSPPTLAQSLAHMVADGRSHAIVEVSSRELAQSVLAGVELDAACVTHVGRDHLDWHGSPQNYRRAKRRIFDHLGDHGLAIFNADDPISVAMLSELDHPALTIGIRQPAEITAEVIEQYVNEQTFVLSAGDESVGVRTAMIGEHHVYNCLTAAALCLAYGIDLTTVSRGLESLQRLPGRMEPVACGQGFAVFVDAAQTPDTLRACLRAARQVTTGRLICVFGGFGDRVLGERPAMGRVVATLADLAVVTSNCPGSEAPQIISAELLRGVDDRRNTKVIVDRTEAIAWALDEARDGDTVVIAGLGDRTYDEPGPDGVALNDCDVATQLLRGTFAWTPPSRLAA